MSRPSKAFLKGLREQLRDSDIDPTKFSRWVSDLALIKQQGQKAGSTNPFPRIHGTPSSVEEGGVDWKATGSPGDAFGGASGMADGAVG